MMPFSPTPDAKYENVLFFGAPNFFGECDEGYMFKKKIRTELKRPLKIILRIVKRYRYTPPNFRVCAQLNALVKCFKNWHMLYIRNPKGLFPFFISSYFNLSPIECPDQCLHST